MPLQRGMAGDDNKITQLFIAPVERNCCNQAAGEICKCCGETIGDDGCNCNPGELLFPVFGKANCSVCHKPLFVGCATCATVPESANHHKICKTLSNNPALTSFKSVKRNQLCYAGIPRGSVCMESSHHHLPPIFEEQMAGAGDALSVTELIESWIVPWRNMRTDNPERYSLRGNPAHLGYPFLGIRQRSEKGLNIHANINNQVSLDKQPSMTRMHQFFVLLDKVKTMQKTSAYEVGKRLQALRKVRGLSQRALCEAINISPAAYNNYEKGKNRPDFDNVVILAAYHSCPTDYIMTGNLMFLPYDLAQQLAALDQDTETG